MPPYSRGQAVYDAGDRLVSLATRMLGEDPPSMHHTALELDSIRIELDRAIKSCRSARGMYHTNPRARRGITKAGERLSDYRIQLIDCIKSLNLDTWRSCAGTFALLGNNIKFLDWHQGEDDDEAVPAPAATPAVPSSDATLSRPTYDPLTVAMQEPSDD